MNYFVTAIDTDSGKTLVSAILCEALKADYWKPIQAGVPRDSDVVQSLVSNQTTQFHPETYLLKTSASPHAAAKIDEVKIEIQDFKVPNTKNHLVIEGAGGCLVPINDQAFIIDLIVFFKARVILVADLYLGSINHTLLTFEALQKRNIAMEGIIFNGIHNHESERIILKHTGLKKLVHISKEDNITKDIVKRYAELLNHSWNG